MSSESVKIVSITHNLVCLKQYRPRLIFGFTCRSMSILFICKAGKLIFLKR